MYSVQMDKKKQGGNANEDVSPMQKHKAMS